MTIVETQRANDRDQLLRSLTDDVSADPRVAAAWLFGSFARGVADCWSDIDVVIAVDDEWFDTYLSERYVQVSRLGEVVLTFESSYNGPPAGCYLMTGYNSPTGLLLVDWYWQPRSAAQMAATKAVLTNRAGLEMIEDTAEPQIALWQKPGKPQPLPIWNPTDEEDRVNCSMLAWAMLAIQTKYIARNPTEVGLTFQEFIETLIGKAMDNEISPYRFGHQVELTTPVDRLRQVEAMAAYLHSAVPASATPKSAFQRFFKTVAAHLDSSEF